MLCLGIESSCDENALAFVCDGKLQAEVVRTQAGIHALFGGVVPELASREHCRYIGPLYDQLLLKMEKAIAEGRVPTAKPDVIAVARGPGLLGSLLVGVAFAKALALSSNIPLVGVNHLHAHLLAVGLEREISFPALGLLASGGHTHIYRVNAPDDFILLGRSIDDAAGEAFDKFGKAMGFAYPAGQRIDALAKMGNCNEKLFPAPYLDNDNLDFSFSGLKTAASIYISAKGQLLQDCAELAETSKLPLPEEIKLNPAWQELAGLCASFNHAVAKTLRVKTERAIKSQQGIMSVILSGGVACNSAVRAVIEDLAKSCSLDFLVPAPSLCTDNAPMIAYTGQLLYEKGLNHGLDLTAIPRGQLVPNDYLASGGI